MIFFANAEGTITKIITEPVYQGSALASRVVLIAPYPNAMVTVAFTLPNGVHTSVNLTTPNMVQQDLQGIIAPTGQKYNAWTYLLPRAITEYAGVVNVQFFVTTGVSGQILATFTTTLTVQKGVPAVLPETPTQDIYEQILEHLTILSEKSVESIIYVDTLPVEDINRYTIYVLTTNDISNFYIYSATLSAWVQIDKAVVTVATAEDIKDSTKLYILSANSGDLQKGVYVLENNQPLRLLSTVDLTEINQKVTALETQVATVKNTADTALTTANGADANASNAVSTANNAQEIATNANATASQAQTTASNAGIAASQAFNTGIEARQMAIAAERKAQQALDKAESATGGLIPKGNISSISDLPTPSAETLGWFYNINDAFTTTDQFVEGAGISYLAGENVAIVEPEPGVYKYDVFSGLVDLSPLENEIDDLKSQIADLTYKAITITSFTNNVGTVEIGSTVTSVDLSWAFSKTPKSVTLDNVSKGIASTGESLTGLSITGNKTWTLKATDERDAVATRTTSISFLNGVYYGVAQVPSSYNSAFVLGLTKVLRGSKLNSFNVDAGAGQYIYYCIPERFGTASFKVGGFDGGFSLVALISFTNIKGYTENYYIYKSDNANLGSTAVSVA